MPQTDILNATAGYDPDLGDSMNPNYGFTRKRPITRHIAKAIGGTPYTRETSNTGHQFTFSWLSRTLACVRRLKWYYEQYEDGYFTMIDYDGGGRHYVGRFTTEVNPVETANGKWDVQGVTFEELPQVPMLQYPNDWDDDSVNFGVCNDFGDQKLSTRGAWTLNARAASTGNYFTMDNPGAIAALLQATTNAWTPDGSPPASGSSGLSNTGGAIWIATYPSLGASGGTLSWGGFGSGILQAGSAVQFSLALQNAVASYQFVIVSDATHNLAIPLVAGPQSADVSGWDLGTLKVQLVINQGGAGGGTDTPEILVTLSGLAVQSFQSTAGDSATYEYKGYGFRLWMRTGPEFGQVNVFLDGVQVAANLDCYAAADGGPAMVLVQEAVVLDFHRVQVVCTGNKNAAATGTAVSWVSLDVMR